MTGNEEMENYRMALAYISKQSSDQQSRELAETALNAFPDRGVPQSPGLSREAVLSAVIAAGNCGIGDTGPDGKWRAIACNDESLKGDRHYFREDCDCSKITDAVLTLVQGPDTRPVQTKGE